MNTIETILSLMRPDLTPVQLGKLQTVLETILKKPKTIPDLPELLRRFESSKRLLGIKDTSISQYSLEVATLAKHTSKPLAELTSADLKDYLAAYKDQKAISMVTVQNKVRFLSSFFEYLVDEGFIDRNPVRGIGRILVEKRIKKSFSADDLARIRASCSSARDRAMVEFLYSTGCRVSECTSLLVKDIDIDASELIVFGKGHKERVCYLSQSARDLLKKYLEDRKAAPDEPLFCRSRSPAPLTSRAVELILKAIGEAASVENVHPHRFRRTFATDLWKSGVPVETIRILMGHTSISTTLRYIDIDPCGAKQAHARAMGKLK